LIIECTNCQAKYQYGEDRFERKPSKKIKCAKCQTVFEIFNPAFAERPEPNDDSTAPRHDETIARPKRTQQDTTEQKPIPVTGPAAVEAKLPAGKRLSVAIIDGEDAGNVFRLDKPRMTIGRSGADIAINDTEVSRLHAAVEVRELIYLLHDLNSTNGTLVNGQRITEPTELQDKSEFQIGSTTFMLIVTDEA
jgi:pSer/pThr/pTyr-binding forkhead associated (FHA) protein